MVGGGAQPGLRGIPRVGLGRGDDPCGRRTICSPSADPARPRVLGSGRVARPGHCGGLYWPAVSSAGFPGSRRPGLPHETSALRGKAAKLFRWRRESSRGD